MSHYGGARASRLLAWAWANLPHTCVICRQPITAGPGARLADGKRDPMRASVEHRLARSRGGSDLTGNLGLAHLSCNSRKGAKTQASDLVVRDGRAFFQ